MEGPESPTPSQGSSGRRPTDWADADSGSVASWPTRSRSTGRGRETPSPSARPFRPEPLAATQPQDGGVDLIDSGEAAESHRQVELGQRAAEHRLHARLAVEGEPPEVGAPDQHGVGAQREGLERVRA